MWLAIAGLGVFHGINPAMGWLFAVALGLYRRSSRVVALSLIPIALGHMIAAGLMLAAGLSLSRVIDHTMLSRLCGAVLIGWAAWHMFRKHRMRTRVGMQTGFVGLAGWSFAMAGSHGAGLMLIPVLMPICNAYGVASRGVGAAGASASTWIAFAALLVHSIAMLLTIAMISFAVFGWFGLAGLRTKWVNFDLLWGLSLGVCGAVQVLSR
ncbi:hypothetical protein [Paraburkholderia flava]|uniref:hypothetical protein n=1 Tax=Paraburkholderia flava TaxID=2547393 RepID=UPI001F0D07AB|nr:hypothetical protein [Paraburkholderia flava]